MTGRSEWALVADGQHARILERLVPGGPWHERMDEMREIQNPPSREQGSERPGRAFDSGSVARSAMEPRQDLHEATKQRFAESLADRLEAAAASGSFASLLLVAPPTFLGYLRMALGDEARRRLRGSLDKDLTKAPLGEIAPHLSDVRPVEE